MTTLSKEVRITGVALAVLDMIIFSRITASLIFVAGAGTALIVLGISYTNRLSAFGGLVMVVGAVAASVQITTLLLMSEVLTALLGLLLPTLVLAFLSLSANEETFEASLQARPTVLSLAFAMLCLWSVPIVSMAVGLLLPTVTMRITETAEISIVMITLVAGALLLTRQQPSTISVALVRDKDQEVEKSYLGERTNREVR